MIYLVNSPVSSQPLAGDIPILHKVNMESVVLLVGSMSYLAEVEGRARVELCWT